MPTYIETSPGYLDRLDKRRTKVHTTSNGQATGWLPFQKSDRVFVNVARSRLTISQQGTGYKSDILPMREAMRATVVLEIKLGGEEDAEALQIDEYEDVTVSEISGYIGSGFARLRLVDYRQDGTPDGVLMTMRVQPGGP